MSIHTTAIRSYNALDCTNGQETLYLGDAAQVGQLQLVATKVDTSLNPGLVALSDGTPMATLQDQGDEVSMFSDGVKWSIVGFVGDSGRPAVVTSGYTMAEVQVDTVAADLAALKVDFNLLLAWQRTFLTAVRSTGAVG